MMLASDLSHLISLDLVILMNFGHTSLCLVTLAVSVRFKSRNTLISSAQANIPSRMVSSALPWIGWCGLTFRMYASHHLSSRATSLLTTAVRSFGTASV